MYEITAYGDVRHTVELKRFYFPNLSSAARCLGVHRCCLQCLAANPNFLPMRGNDFERGRRMFPFLAMEFYKIHPTKRLRRRIKYGGYGSVIGRGRERPPTVD